MANSAQHAEEEIPSDVTPSKEVETSVSNREQDESEDRPTCNGSNISGIAVLASALDAVIIILFIY